MGLPYLDPNQDGERLPLESGFEPSILIERSDIPGKCGAGGLESSKERDTPAQGDRLLLPSLKKLPQGLTRR